MIPVVSLEAPEGTKYLTSDSKGVVAWSRMPMPPSRRYDWGSIWTDSDDGPLIEVETGLGVMEITTTGIVEQETAWCSEVKFPVIASEARKKIVEVRCAST